MTEENVLLYTAIGLRIRHLRLAKGIDQKGFAFDCEISRTQLHHIEKGEVNIRLGTLNKIAIELEVSLEEFFKDLL